MPQRTDPPAVLVVDDEPMIRRIAGIVLQSEGFAVVEAGDGRAAADLVRADPNRFTVVILDLLMPVMDGRAALAEIRAVAPTLPVVLVSGSSNDDVSDISTAGGVTFLRKPFRPAELTARVREIVAAASESR
ncbi:MAG: response regulator [Fimbriiglobus sp.]